MTRLQEGGWEGAYENGRIREETRGQQVCAETQQAGRADVIFAVIILSCSKYSHRSANEKPSGTANSDKSSSPSFAEEQRLEKRGKCGVRRGMRAGSYEL